MTSPLRTVGLFLSALALALACIVALGKPSRAELHITRDAGGDFLAYRSQVSGLHSSGERVVIDGLCGSACTMVLNLPASQICATPRGVFVFHSARDQWGLPHPAANDELLDHVYPRAVRDFIVRRGGLWFNEIKVKATRFVRPCR